METLAMQPSVPKVRRLPARRSLYKARFSGRFNQGPPPPHPPHEKEELEQWSMKKKKKKKKKKIVMFGRTESRRRSKRPIDDDF